MARRLSSRKQDNGAGHNSGGMTDRDGLNRYTDRIMVQMAERDAVNDGIKQIYEEAKEAGFVPKILRKIVAEMRMDAEARVSQYNLLDEYRQALGLYVDTPLGAAAMAAAEEQPRRRRGRPRNVVNIDAVREEFDDDLPPAV